MVIALRHASKVIYYLVLSDLGFPLDLILVPRTLPGCRHACDVVIDWRYCTSTCSLVVKKVRLQRVIEPVVM